MGIEGESGRLAALHQAIETGLSPLGWLTEKRSFRGHLTLARAKGRGTFDKSLGGILTQCEPRDAIAFQVDHLALYRSRLQPGGAVYDKLGQWILSPPAP
jgi:2'-5' RNA ligase